MPLPYCAAPTNAETEPDRAGETLRAPAIELATIKPVAEAKMKSGTTSPHNPPEPPHAASATIINLDIDIAFFVCAPPSVIECKVPNDPEQKTDWLPDLF